MSHKKKTLKQTKREQNNERSDYVKHLKKALLIITISLLLTSPAHAYCKYIYIDGKAVWVCDYN